MRIGIVVNVMGGDASGATSYRIAAEAIQHGHEVWIMSSGGFSYEPDDRVGGLARRVPEGRYDSAKFLTALKRGKAIERWITLDELDVLLLRSNPSAQSAWAQSAGIHFGRLAMRRGVLVLNDPNGLSNAMNKLYLQTFPESVRPRTLVARHPDRIKEFLLQEGTLILKPLQGSGGDVRSNIHAGGKLRRAHVDDDMLRLADTVRPRLVEDGMFLVGLDIVGDKLIEINVLSPGGLGSAQMFEKVNFNEAVVEALERTVNYMKSCHRDFSNVALATM